MNVICFTSLIFFLFKSQQISQTMDTKEESLIKFLNDSSAGIFIVGGYGLAVHDFRLWYKFQTL